MKIRAFTLSLLASLFILTGAACQGGDREAQDKAVPVTITYWTVAAHEDSLRSMANNYKASHPNVTFSIKVIPEEGYDQRLLEAWADGAGPDIFSIPNNSVYKYLNKIEPMPASTNLPYQVITGTVKKEAQWFLRNRNLYTLQAFDGAFVPQVANDAIIDNKIYGIPLSFDSLALYTNRDILNNSNIISVPETWIPFIETVRNMTLRDQDNNIIQSAVAMGRVDNIMYAQDILSLIMMQNGAKMTETNSRNASFDKNVTTAQGTSFSPGQQAAFFYADFASPAKEVYTWNESFPNSREAFMSGQAAMFFGYARDRVFIETEAPSINFEVSAFPQIDGSPIKYNFAKYWLEVVNKRSENIEWAWDFVTYITNEDNSERYINAAQLPTAHRALLLSQTEQYPNMRVFNKQALTATSWYQGRQPEVAEKLLGEVIEIINSGTRSGIPKILKSIVSKINQTL